jgi:MYXO-CTERM domain-containing protein
LFLPFTLGPINGVPVVDLTGKGIVVTAPVPGPGPPLLVLPAVLLAGAGALARRQR